MRERWRERGAGWEREAGTELADPWAYRQPVLRPAPGKRTRVDRVYRSAAGAAPPAPDAVSALEQAAAAGGRALPPELRALLEQALGVSLAGVRVHDDAASAEAAEAIAARAYTVGQDIHFARGAYAPHDPEGRRLIAHEVAHAVQHGGGGAPAGELLISQPQDAAEKEAERFADDFAAGGRAAPVVRSGDAAVIHREADDRDAEAEHRAALARIQGRAMSALLPALRALAPAAARKDEKSARRVGGRRLVIAQRAALHRGTWRSFVEREQEALAGLPGNQVSEIMSFLGAPDGAAYYDARKFGGQFDGMVDPGAGTLTLFWRVKVVAPESARFGETEPAPPEQQQQHEKWQRETAAALATFEKGLPAAIQATWKATLAPAHPIGPIGPGKPLRCGVVVTVVDSGQHKLVHLHPKTTDGRSNMPKNPRKPGNLQVGDNRRTTEVLPVDDGTGKMAAKPLPVTRTTSAHEFGHAVGLDHPVCEGGDPTCYGRTADEKSSVMGYGSTLVETHKGHSDFVPFVRIAEAWGSDHPYPGQAGVHNKWSPVGT